MNTEMNPQEQGHIAPSYQEEVKALNELSRRRGAAEYVKRAIESLTEKTNNTALLVGLLWYAVSRSGILDGTSGNSRKDGWLLTPALSWYSDAGHSILEEAAAIAELSAERVIDTTQIEIDGTPRTHIKICLDTFRALLETPKVPYIDTVKALPQFKVDGCDSGDPVFEVVMLGCSSELIRLLGGDHLTALLLDKIAYLAGAKDGQYRGDRADGWIGKSIAEWVELVSLPPFELSRFDLANATVKLEGHGLIEAKLSPENGRSVLYLRFRFDKNEEFPKRVKAAEVHPVPEAAPTPQGIPELVKLSKGVEPLGFPAVFLKFLESNYVAAHMLYHMADLAGALNGTCQGISSDRYIGTLHQEWSKYCGASQGQQNRARGILRAKGLIEEKAPKGRSTSVKYFRLNFMRLQELLQEHLQEDRQEFQGFQDILHLPDVQRRLLEDLGLTTSRPSGFSASEQAPGEL